MYTLHYWQFYNPETKEFETLAEAKAYARTMFESGTGNPERVTDETGAVVYTDTEGPGPLYWKGPRPK